MRRKQKRFGKEKHLFKSYYCGRCRQRKPCGKLTSYTEQKNYCCSCYYEREKERSQEYADYQQVYRQKVREQKAIIKQLRLLQDYQGCKNCGSLAVDAYELYENNKLVCQPCLVEKTGGESSSLSWGKQSQWYQKRWGINAKEWLDKYQCLPVNADCAAKWLKDKEHLSNCACLEVEAKETYELFANSLKEKQEKLTKCQCETSEKLRVGGDYYTKCEGCEEYISVASKKRVIKNRNDPTFWGLNVGEQVLCGGCLKNLVGQMPARKKYLFNEYKKRGYWK